MHEATVTVATKSPPDPGKKTWKLLTSTGELFLIWPNDEHYYEAGKTYKLSYTSSDFNGRTYHTAKGAPAPAGGRAVTASASGAPSNGNGRQMFVCAIVKEWVPKIPVAETTTLISAIQSAMDAYDETFGRVE